MPATRKDVVVPKGVWTDLYTASNVMTGAAVNVYNKGVQPCMLYIGISPPISSSAGIPLYGGGNSGSTVPVPNGEEGLWAYAVNGAVVLVQD